MAIFREESFELLYRFDFSKRNQLFSTALFGLDAAVGF